MFNPVFQGLYISNIDNLIKAVEQHLPVIGMHGILKNIDNLIIFIPVKVQNAIHFFRPAVFF